MLRAAFWTLAVGTVIAAAMGAWWLAGGAAYLCGTVLILGMLRAAMQRESAPPLEAERAPSGPELPSFHPAA